MKRSQPSVYGWLKVIILLIWVYFVAHHCYYRVQSLVLKPINKKQGSSSTLPFYISARLATHFPQPFTILGLDKKGIIFSHTDINVVKMEQPRKRDGSNQDAAKRNVKQEQRQNKAPQGLEGMNFEEQRGSLKNSDYGGAVRNTSSGRNSSDVSQDEIK